MRRTYVWCDIEHFKRVNDTYGHSEGDIVLKQLSSLLLGLCGKDEVISRNGGEEFTVILTDCALTYCLEIEEKIS